MINRLEVQAELAAWVQVPIMSVAVMIGLFVVQTAGHLTFFFNLTGPADLTRACLHFLTFGIYTAATIVYVLICGIMIYDGRVIENKMRQMSVKFPETRCNGPFNRNSRMFSFVLTDTLWHQTGIRISLEILALGSMFLARDMRMMHDVNLLDACTLISGALVFILLLVVVELPFLWAGFYRRKEIIRRRRLRNHARLSFIVH